MVRSRVAVPVIPPALAHSHRADDDPTEDRDPTTSPVGLPDDVVLINEVSASSSVTAKALAELALFNALPEASRGFLAAGATVLTLPKGELLFAQGEPSTSFYVVLEGRLEITTQRDGRQAIVRAFEPGDAIGVFEGLSAMPRSAAGRASDDSAVLVLSAKKLQALVSRDGDLRERLFQAHRARLLDGLMSHAAFIDVDASARNKLRARLLHRELPPGHALLNPGEVANVIGVVTSGSLTFEGRAGPSTPGTHVEIGPGQFFVIGCAQSGVPSRHRLVTHHGATVSMTTHHAAGELFREAQGLQSLPQRLGTLAQQLDRDLFCGVIALQGQ